MPFDTLLQSYVKIFIEWCRFEQQSIVHQESVKFPYKVCMTTLPFYDDDWNPCKIKIIRMVWILCVVHSLQSFRFTGIYHQSLALQIIK